MSSDYYLSVATILFWLSTLLVIYPYLIYPLALVVLNVRNKKSADSTVSSIDMPSVAIVISAYNEEKVISEKLETSLALKYPSDKLSIFVVSDASDDATDSIVEQWVKKDSRIAFIKRENREGKSLGINAAMKVINSEIVVFTDANAIFRNDALLKLVAEFNSPEIGYVVGAAQYIEESSEAVKVSEGAYWKYELWIKKQESDFHSVVGGDGAIYAIRRNLFWPFLKNDINDFVNPMQIIAQGYRGVFTPAAMCYEQASDEFSKEFHRKRRIVNRSWRAVRSNWRIFSFSKHWKFLFMLISHKIIRWYSLFFLMLALITCAYIVWSSMQPFYIVVIGVQVATMLLALLGCYLDNRGKTIPPYIYIPYYFYLVGSASLLGIWDNVRGISYSTWAHIRR